MKKKYNIGDTVYFKENDIIISDEIVGLDTGIRKDGTKEYQYMFLLPSGFIFKKEDELFESEELARN